MSPSGLPSLLAAIAGKSNLPGEHRLRKCLMDDQGRWLSYGDVIDRAHDITRQIRQYTGGAVLLGVRNDIESALAFLAAWAAELAVLMVDSSAHPVALDRMVSAFTPELLYKPDTGLVETRLVGPSVTPGTGILLSTSGTTGTTKFVRLHNAALFANATQIS